MKFLSLIILFFLFNVSTFAFFSDVKLGDQYYQAIKYAKDNKIINGYGDGTFKPFNKITRAEFTKIVIKASFDEYKIKGSDCFIDIKDEWFSKYICFAKHNNIINGYVNGYVNGYFQPYKDISFVEAAKIIVLAFNFYYSKDEDVWHKPFVNLLSIKKAIPTSIVDINTKITRGDMVEIIWRLKKDINNENYMLFENNNCLCVPSGQSYGYIDTQYSINCCEGSISRGYSELQDNGSCLEHIGGAVCIPCGKWNL